MRHPVISDEMKIKMCNLVYFTDLSYSQIAQKCYTSAASVSRYALHVYSPQQLIDRVAHLKSKDHDRHLRSNPQAYCTTETPAWFRGLSNYGKSYTHVVNWCKANGVTHVPEGYVVHHIDHDRRNNASSNLQLMTRAEHTSHHFKGVSRCH